MKFSTAQLIWIYRLSLAVMVTVVLVIMFFALGLDTADSGPDDVLPNIIVGMLMLSPINFLLSLAAFFSARKLCIEPESPYNSSLRFTKALLLLSAIPTCFLIIWLLIMLQWGFDLGSVR